MKLEVTELGPTKRALKIEIPEEEVSRRFTQAYAELNRQVRVPGFRPGKAPVSLLEKRYAKDVEEDVVRRLLPDYYDRAIRQAGIVPVVVEIPPVDRIKIQRNTPFTFTATVEIKPKIELRDYRPPNPISLKPDKRTITQEQIDRAVQGLREQQAQLHPAPAGKLLVEGDYAALDIEGFLDLAPLEGTKKEGHLYQVGSKLPVLGVEVDEQIIGKKEGDFVEIPQPYPENHPDTRLAGKTVTFRVRIASVKEKKLPDLDDEFAKDCGHYASLEELKDTLQTEMEKALQKDKEEQHKDTILKRLEETHHFDIPETLIERELMAMVRATLRQRRRQTGKTDQLEEALDSPEGVTQLREQHHPEAKRRVKVGLILEAIADREGLTVEEEDIEAEIQSLAAQLKLPVDEVRKLILAGGEESREELRGRIQADKAVDFVYRHAVIQG